MCALGNAADFCLATLPMALPPKNFLLKITNQKFTTLPIPDDLDQYLPYEWVTGVIVGVLFALFSLLFFFFLIA